jgi:SsrA-binding protein
MTLVPTQVYFRDGRAKVEIAVARGKRRYDKRETIKQREAERESRRAMKDAGRS